MRYQSINYKKSYKILYFVDKTGLKIYFEVKLIFPKYGQLYRVYHTLQSRQTSFMSTRTQRNYILNTQMQIVD